MPATPQVTVIGNFIDLGGNNVSGSAEFLLVSPTGQQDLRIVGTGIFAPKIIQSGFGTSFSVTLYGNDVIVDTGGNTNTTYTVTCYNQNQKVFWTATYSFTGSGTINLVSASPLSPAPVVSQATQSPLQPALGGTGVAQANANTIFGGPIVGGATAPAFRSLVAADLPFINNNNIYVVDNKKYLCTAAGINQAIVDAIAASVAQGGSHVGASVDARLCSGNITMSSQINVGNSSQQAVTLWLPNGARWTFTMTDGTSCGIVQYAGTTIIGPGLGGGSLSGRMELVRGAGSSLLATYCTRYAQTAAGADFGYYYAGGFMVYQPDSTATTSGYGAIFSGAYDASKWESVEVADSAGNGAWVHGVCCSTTFKEFVSNSSGGVPLTIGWHSSSAGVTNTSDISFINASIDHPLSGKNNIVIDQGQPTGLVRNINFYNLYGEGTMPGGSTVPMLSIGQNVDGIAIWGGAFNSEVATGSSQPCIQVETVATGIGTLLVENFWCTNFQNSTAIINNIKNGTVDNGQITAGNLTYFHRYSAGRNFFSPNLSTTNSLAGIVYSGTTVDVTAQQGALHYRTDLNLFRWSDGSNWHSIPGLDLSNTFTNRLNLTGNTNTFTGAGSAPLILTNSNSGTSAGFDIVFVGDGSISRAAIKAKTGSTATDVGGITIFAGGQGSNALDGQWTLSTTSLTTTVPSVAAGAAAGLSGTGACATITTQLGGSWAGSFKCTGTTGASTVVITPGPTAPNGWSCSASDVTTANALRQSASAPTTCTISGTVNANDVLTFTATAF